MEKENQIPTHIAIPKEDGTVHLIRLLNSAMDDSYSYNEELILELHNKLLKANKLVEDIRKYPYKHLTMKSLNNVIKCPDCHASFMMYVKCEKCGKLDTPFGMEDNLCWECQ